MIVACRLPSSYICNSTNTAASYVIVTSEIHDRGHEKSMLQACYVVRVAIASYIRMTDRPQIHRYTYVGLRLYTHD